MKLPRLPIKLPPMHRPKMPPVLRATWQWIWDAAKVEPRVAVGLFLVGLLSVVVLIIGLIMMVALAGGAGLVAILNVLFLVIIITLGLGLPLFLVVAFPKLFIQIWDIVPEGINEQWAHPRERLNYPPAYIKAFNGTQRIVRMANPAYTGKLGSAEYLPFTGRAARSAYSWVDIRVALDKTEAANDFKRKQKNMWEKINVWALVALVGVLAFWGLAIMSEGMKAQ
jgi:hypothetical protein